MTEKVCRLLLVVCVFVLGSAVMSAAPPPVPVIDSATYDAIHQVLTLSGENLTESGLTPTVEFDEALLPVITATATQVTATLPNTTLPGSYLVVLHTSAQKSDVALFVMTIGAAVAQGPAGPMGPSGLPGPQGPQGLQGPKGDKGGLTSFNDLNALPCSIGGTAGTMSLSFASNGVATLTCNLPPPPPQAPINLGSAATFGIASRAGLTSTGVTVVNGDVALYPTPTCTDSTGNAGATQTCSVQTYSSSMGMTVNGKIYFAGDPFDNGVTANSVTNDLNSAWTEGKNKVDTMGPIAGDEMGFKTLFPGVYHNASLRLAAGGVATLDAQNDAKAVFIFKVDGGFTDSGNLSLPSRIDLINGAQTRNVWFVIGGNVTIGSATNWNGNILAGGSITVNNGSTVKGRVLGGAAGAGAVTLAGAASSVTTISVP
jgi:hypothetical protein